MTNRIPANPAVLRWARECLGLSLEEVAERVKKRPADVEAWEAGRAAPTYVQLETLAYKIYKRPVALFFFPEPPDEPPVRQSFRTLPEEELDAIPPSVRYLLRKAAVLQANLYEIFGGANPAARHVLRDLVFAPSVSAVRMAKEVRAYLGVDLSEQQTWHDAGTALHRWRDALEAHGVFVFKDSFNPPGPRSKRRDGSDRYSGFCLYDAEFPLIYVNNNLPKTRQIFTLFHELAHLFMKTGGIDTEIDRFVADLEGDARRVETLCNAFAAEFLVPGADFAHQIRDVPIDEKGIDGLARLYSVSREVILRRLRDRDRVAQEEYERLAAQWKDQTRTRKGAGGGDYYETTGAYLGQRYIGQVISRYSRRGITADQAADYLGVKVEHLPGVEEWLLKRGSAA